MGEKLNININIDKNVLLDLLKEAFESGCFSYMDLKDSVTEEIMDRHIEKFKDIPIPSVSTWETGPTYVSSGISSVDGTVSEIGSVTLPGGTPITQSHFQFADSTSPSHMTTVTGNTVILSDELHGDLTITNHDSTEQNSLFENMSPMEEEMGHRQPVMPPSQEEIDFFSRNSSVVSDS